MAILQGVRGKHGGVEFSTSLAPPYKGGDSLRNTPRPSKNPHDFLMSPLSFATAMTFCGLPGNRVTRKGSLSGSTSGLLRLHRVLGLYPFVPSALEGVHLGKSVLLKLLCHPGTGCLAGSGTVEDQGLLLGIFGCPGINVCRVLPDRALNFRRACLPIPATAHIQDHDVAVAKPSDLSSSFVILGTSAARAVLRSIAVAATLNAIANPVKTRRFIHVPPSVSSGCQETTGPIIHGNSGRNGSGRPGTP